MQEKRRFTRVELKSRVQVRAESTTYEGTMHDLSLSGVLVVAPGKPELGTKVNIELMLAGPKTELAIELRGKVIRHTDTGFGLTYDLESFELDSFLHLRNVIAYIQDDPQQIAEEFKQLLADQADQAFDL
ncbi:MAG: PilZ domain-containing protein [Deltaproteobacteria bacterium]|nr:PilZ domain-containing protein [Deltaproteobacteria bacterium]